MKKIILTTETDAILFLEDRQEVLSWFKSKLVHKVAVTSDGNFIALCSKPYDTKFTLYRSDNQEFKRKI